MGIIANAKEVADLVKELGDVELYRKICELEGEILDLTRSNRHWEEKVEEQQQLLAIKAKMNWENPFYRIVGESDPYCPLCWEKSQKPIHLAMASEHWFCRNCGKTIE